MLFVAASAQSAALPIRFQRFVDAYIVEPNATKAAIAAGYSERTAKQQGSRLLTRVDVGAAIAARQAKASKKADLTLEAHLATLNSLRDQAAAAEQFAPAVSAEVSRGKAAGLYVDRKEHSFNGPLEVRVRITREGRRATAS